MKKLVKIISYIFVFILCILAIICLSVFIQTRTNPDKIPSILGYKPFIVLSGSMETELSKGDLAIVRNVDVNDLKEKDIIAFREKDGYVVTHRIVSVFKNGDNVYFITKGDNNNTNDNGMVKSNRVEGKYVTKINGFGNVLLVLQKPITLIVILIIIVLIGIIWIGFDKNKLNEEERKELEKLRKEKNRKKSK